MRFVYIDVYQSLLVSWCLSIFATRVRLLKRCQSFAIGIFFFLFDAAVARAFCFFLCMRSEHFLKCCRLSLLSVFEGAAKVRRECAHHSPPNPPHGYIRCGWCSVIRQWQLFSTVFFCGQHDTDRIPAPDLRSPKCRVFGLSFTRATSGAVTEV